MNRIRSFVFRGVFLSCLVCVGLVTAYAQTPAFTYQGKLTDGVAAANGTYEMQFSLFDSVGGPTQVGSTITKSSVTVANGIFTVSLDFSPATPFSTGADRFLQIAVRKASDPPGFTTLTPRQQITSSPYSIRTLSASNADNLGGLPANQYVQFGSNAYIHNDTFEQSANFNINGSGTMKGTLFVGDVNVSASANPPTTGTVNAVQMTAFSGSLGYTFNGDTDTGMRTFGPDDLHFFTSGLPRLHIAPSGGVTVPGSLTVGSVGAAITSIFSATGTLDFPNTAAGDSSDLTIAVSGAQAGDVVSLGVPNGSVVASSSYSAWVSSSNTITVRFLNGGGAASNPASGTFRVMVIRF